MAKIFSTEDGNLNKSIRVKREREYSDIDLSLSARTETDGDVFKKTDAAAVKQAVKNLLLTNQYDKPYRPQFGGNLGGLLFELMDADTGDEIIDRIKKAIETYEPRAKILNVRVIANPDTNSIIATIEFRVISTNVVDSLKISLNPSTTNEIPFLPLETSPFIIFDEIIRSEDDKRLATYDGKLIKRNHVSPPDDALLTDPDRDMILVEYQGFIEGILLRDEDTEGGLLTSNEDKLITQRGELILTQSQESL